MGERYKSNKAGILFVFAVLLSFSVYSGAAERAAERVERAAERGERAAGFGGKPGVRKLARNGGVRYVEVEIRLSEEFDLAYISGLPRAAGNEPEVLGDSGRVKVQLPVSVVTELAEAGAEVEPVRKFVLIEGSGGGAESLDGDIGPLGTCEGTYEYAYNNDNYLISDSAYWWGSPIIDFDGGPVTYPVSCIDIHYDITVNSWNYFDVKFSGEDYANMCPLVLGRWGADGDISETDEGVIWFNGEPINQEWVLWAGESATTNSSYINSWWIKLYYEEDYCYAEGDYCAEGDYISRVQVGDIDNTSGCDNYGDYTSLSTSMEIGESYPIQVDNYNAWDEQDQCGIWVDWNQDLDFYDAGETIAVSGTPGYGPYTATITPPSGAALGSTRMRVRIRWTGDLEPCALTPYGDVEDYTITVTSEPQTLKVSGHVTLSDGSPLSGVLLEAYYGPFTPSGLTDISDENGYYEITLDSPWTGHIEADKDHYSFNWPTQFTDVTTDQTQDFSAYYTYSGGFGTSGQPYLIATPEDMNAIGAHTEDWDKYFKMIADIDMSVYTGTEFSNIGTFSDPFSGVFDGNDHTISNFTYTTSSDLIPVGMFGYVDGVIAEIKNLVLRDPNLIINGSTSGVGTLVGTLERGTISNCGVDGGNVDGTWVGGGLVLENNFGTINNCYFSGSVTAGTAGGLIGHNRDGSVSVCYSKGTVSGGGSVGGLVGQSSGSSLIEDCYSNSSVTGWWDFVFVGGLVGYSIDSSTVNRCYSVGKVSGSSSDVGGLIGERIGGTVISSFWDKQTSEQETSAGGTGKTTAEMQTQSTFTDAGWDFTTPVWKMGACGGYPRLWWETVKYGGGRGTSGEPYLICTAEQMNAIGADSNDWDKHFKLTEDIDLNDYDWQNPFKMIGDSTTQFTGVFDGNGRKIYNFSYFEFGTDYVGIFRFVSDPNAQIKNLGLIAPYVFASSSSDTDIGALVGWFTSGTIDNCYVEGGNISGYWHVGALVGYNKEDGIITNCYAANNSVLGGRFAGGLVGYNKGSITRSYASGSVSGGNFVGGLVGSSYNKISNCYSRASVVGDNTVGGLGGYNDGHVYNCYSVGSVSSTGTVGGLFESNTGTVINSFWDVNSSGQKTSDGGVDKTTFEMQRKSTFTDAGWDFVGETVNGPNDIWDICEGTNYPKLTWQIPFEGDFVCPDGVEMNDLAVLCEQWLLEELSWDVWADGGDGMVDFLDWAVFANGWYETTDMEDLSDFVGQWMRPSAYCMDIAPEPDGDGFVDMLDFAVLADNWLAGFNP